MNVRLMTLRKAAGYSNRDEFAKKLGVNKYTYRSWESGAAMMNAEQIWNCAEALGCTPNDILGWYEEHPKDKPDASKQDPFVKELVACYRASTPDRQDRILDTARDAAGMSKEMAERGVSAAQERAVKAAV